MGQRLNIEIRRRKDNKVLANSYYHWSAYTSSSLNLAEEIIQNVFDILHNKVSDEIKAIELLQSTGSGLLESEYNELKEEDKKFCKISSNRNLGLISFTEKGIENTRLYEEGRITLDIDFDDTNSFLEENCYLEFEVYSQIDKEEVLDYYKEYIESGKLNLEKITELNFDLQMMSLKDIISFKNELNNIEDNFGLFKIKGNNDILYRIIY